MYTNKTRPRLIVEWASTKNKEEIEMYELTENQRYCKHIADELEDYVAGNVRMCPECNEEIRRDWDSVRDKFKCPECGDVQDIDSWDTVSIYDYLSDALDIEYRISAGGEYRSVKIAVTLGGPNIYIDTSERAVKLYWWNERAEWGLSSDACDAVDEWASEYYQMVKEG